MGAPAAVAVSAAHQQPAQQERAQVEPAARAAVAAGVALPGARAPRARRRPAHVGLGQSLRLGHEGLGRRDLSQGRHRVGGLHGGGGRGVPGGLTQRGARRGAHRPAVGGDVGGHGLHLGVETGQARAQGGPGARVVLLALAGRGQGGVDGGLGLGQVVQGGQGVAARRAAAGLTALRDGGLGVGHERGQSRRRDRALQALGVHQVRGDRGDGRLQVLRRALEPLAGPGDLRGQLTGLGDRALGDTHLLHRRRLLGGLDAGARLVQGRAPGGQQAAGLLRGLRHAGQGGGRVGGAQGDQDRLGHDDGLLGLVGPLGGLRDRRRQVRLDPAPLVEGLLLSADLADRLRAVLEDLGVHLPLLRLGLGDVVVEDLAQLEAPRQVLAGTVQSGGEGVRGGQPELRLGVGQLLGGGAHRVIGLDQSAAGLGAQLLDRHRRGACGLVPRGAARGGLLPALAEQHVVVLLVLPALVHRPGSGPARRCDRAPAQQERKRRGARAAGAVRAA